MSRMDRYKDKHKEMEKATEKKGFSPRKQRPQERFDAHDEFDEFNEYDEQPEELRNDYQSSQRYQQQQTYQTHQQDRQQQRYQTNKTTNNNHSGFGSQKKGKQPKIKKPRKKRRGLKLLGSLLLLLILYCGGMFAYGKYSAEHDTSLPKEELETFNGVTGADKANNILLIGSDSRGEETGRADTIMVIQLDGAAKKPKMISFMRDTFVTIPGVGENKINAAYAFGGADLVRQTLAENFGIDCKYYVKVDFQSFEKVIDSLFPNGVQIDAEKDMSSHLEVPIKKGPQKMDGLTLLQYARFRMDEEGDFGRVRRQQQTMSAIFSQMKNPLTLINLPLAAGKAIGYTSTNIPTSFLLKNTFSVAKGAGGVDSLSVPIKDSWSYGNSDYAGSVLVIDKEQNKQAIQAFFAN
ncbi:transcriptional regulator [Enterococcus sp. JM4C]|uniref:LCP family protein n=1 Tax=Candidatus Enterococcus huntleyi TaxID=1857217 RepID=UPI0013797DEA|nr:LCP family protein [Enterococcus sp. JM4C]KAF1296087.1 transcriptional regulator [Enterococcus sp. JM4C]